METFKEYSKNACDKVTSLFSWTKNFYSTPIGISHGLLAIYASGYTMQIALLPYVVMELNQPVQVNGYALGLFSFCQLLGALVFGRLADFIGPRNAFLLAMGSSATMYLLMTIASTTFTLLLSQIPAVLMHGFQAAVLLVCYETSDEKRTPAIAYLNLSYGLGMFVGGLVGAFISAIAGPRGALLVAAAIQIAGCFLSFTLDRFNELHTPEKLPEEKNQLQFLKIECSRMFEILKKSGSMCILLVCGLLPILMTRFAFAPVAVDQFGLSPPQSNYLVTLIGLVTFLAEGVLAPALASAFGDMNCNRWSVPLAFIGYLGLVLIGTYSLASIVLFLMIPLCGGALLYVCGTSQMTKRVKSSEIGSVLGLNGSIFFATAGLSQFVGLPLYAHFGMRAYWAFCAICSGLLSFYLFVIDPRTLRAYVSDSGRESNLSVFQ